MTDRSDPLADEEARLAASEAANIGGRPTYEDDPDIDADPAYQAINESGEGEAEGFELAEEELRDHAEQGPGRPGGEIRLDRAEVDRETEGDDPQREAGLYGEGDREAVSELDEDDNR
jgi:hypothetical protein